MTHANNVKEDQQHKYVAMGPELFQQRNADDEISFFDLWEILSRKRNLIIGVFAVTIAASVAVAFLMPPVYQATIHFRAPYPSDVESLNIPNFSSGYTAEDVFISFQNNFNARDNLISIFIDEQLYSAYLNEKNPANSHIMEVFEKYFIKDMAMHRPKNEKENTIFAHATLDWKNSADSAALLNKYSEYVLTQTIQQYADELQNKLDIEKKIAQENIDLLRISGARLKKNRLAELEENISIAKELGFKRSRGLEKQIMSEVSVSVLEEQPLYYQGYEVLEAEKRALLARKDNDPFINGLEKELRRLEYLNAIKVNEDDIQAAWIIQKAGASNQSIKPNKKQILVVAGIFGLFLGILMAFISHAVASHQFN